MEVAKKGNVPHNISLSFPYLSALLWLLCLFVFCDLSLPSFSLIISDMHTRSKNACAHFFEKRKMLNGTFSLTHERFNNF